MTVTGWRYLRGVTNRWRPWRALADRPHIELALVSMPPGAPRAVYARRGDDAVVLIDRTLSPAERLAVLAHELVHDERGGSGDRPDLPRPLAELVGREETRVDRIVAARLVPVDELRACVDRMADLGAVAPLEVAEEFGVPERVAVEAMRQLAERRAS